MEESWPSTPREKPPTVRPKSSRKRLKSSRKRRQEQESQNPYSAVGKFMFSLNSVPFYLAPKLCSLMKLFS